MDKEIEEIKREKFANIKNSECIVIERTGPDWVIHRWNDESVDPISVYSSARLAAGRILQLLHIGPVGPQDHPETIEIELPQ